MSNDQVKRTTQILPPAEAETLAAEVGYIVVLRRSLPVHASFEGARSAADAEARRHPGADVVVYKPVSIITRIPAER